MQFTKKQKKKLKWKVSMKYSAFKQYVNIENKYLTHF